MQPARQDGSLFDSIPTPEWLMPEPNLDLPTLRFNTTLRLPTVRVRVLLGIDSKPEPTPSAAVLPMRRGGNGERGSPRAVGDPPEAPRQRGTEAPRHRGTDESSAFASHPARNLIRLPPGSKVSSEFAVAPRRYCSLVQSVRDNFDSADPRISHPIIAVVPCS